MVVKNRIFHPFKNDWDNTVPCQAEIQGKVEAIVQKGCSNYLMHGNYFVNANCLLT